MTIKNQLILCCASLLLFVPSLAAATDNQSDSFYSAIRANDLPRLGAMLEQGAGVNVADERGLTPLMYAAYAGSADAMRLLIDKGAHVNAQNAFGSTALMWSVTDLKKVRLLTEHGADVNAASKQGRTALLLAALSDHSAAIVRLLISKGAGVKAVDAMKASALHAATAGNDTDTIRMLVDAGLDVNARDFLDNTPLMNAAGQGNLAAVKLLIAKGADVNAMSSKDKLFKVKNGPIALGGFTPLLLAAAFGPSGVVKSLIDAGADVNVKDIRGMTPLMLAVATDRQNPETIRALLAKGADVKIKSLAGETALDWARKIGTASAVDVLQRAGAPAASARTVPVATSSAPTGLKPAVERSLVLLEKTSNEFFVNGGCVSCHAQNVTDIAVTVARAKGLPVDGKAWEDRQKMIRSFFVSAGPGLLERMDVPGSPDVQLYSLAALAATSYQPDRMTDALVANLAAQQLADGRWHMGTIARPPIEDGDFFRTALGIRGLKAYGTPARGPEIAERIKKAKDWLLTTPAVTAEDRNMQLLGLRWAGADTKVLQRLAKAIRAGQRSDGGWAQRDELASDAYATGQSLYTLAEGAGIAPGDAGYQKGVKYLLSTQLADGSWYVRSRAPKFQPYFESGFPHGQDQWISSMATGWAAAALALAIDEKPVKIAAMR
jgi:ankyrin repeat protein